MTRSRKTVLAGVVVAATLLALTFLIQGMFPPIVLRTADHKLLPQLEINMSASAVMDLLGPPEQATKGRFLPSGSYQMGALRYTLDDGRAWAIILDEHDKVAAAGEPEIRASPPPSARNSSASRHVDSNPRIDAIKHAFSRD